MRIGNMEIETINESSNVLTVSVTTVNDEGQHSPFRNVHISGNTGKVSPKFLTPLREEILEKLNEPSYRMRAVVKGNFEKKF